MSLTGFKSFLGSFVLSLFMIFFVNSFFAAEKKDNVIPQKNISLFLKNSPHGTERREKIALIKSISDESKDFSVEPVDSGKIIKNTINDISAPIKDLEAPIDVKSNTAAPTPRKAASATKKISTETPPPSRGKKSDLSAQKQAAITLSKEISEKILLSAPPTTQKNNNSPTSEVEQKKEDKPSETVMAALLETKAESPKDIAKDIKQPVKQTAQSDNLLIPLEKENSSQRKSTELLKINPPSAENQVAMFDFNKPVSAIIDNEEKAQSTEKSDDKWQTMAEKHGDGPAPRESKEVYQRPQIKPLEQETPWVAAKGTKFPVNNAILDEEFYKNSDNINLSGDISSPTPAADADNKKVKLAGEVVDNILIPIPDDILNDKNLMPDLVSDPKNKPLEDRLKQKEASYSSFQPQNSPDEIPFIASKDKNEKNKKESSEKGLFSSLTSLFSSDKSQKNQSEDESSSQENDEEEEISSFKYLADNRAKMKILPSEIRLSFQPDRAEISGKTLDWLKAFAQKAIENDDVALEIRIDGASSYALQQKRLNLLYNILTNLGLGYAKVHTVFTAREPNSFILRAVKTSEDSNKKLFDPASSYYRM